jgi:hypothetical protein
LVAADSDTQIGPKLFVVHASNALRAIMALHMPRANPERRFIDGGAAVGISRELDFLVAMFISSKRMCERWTARFSAEPWSEPASEALVEMNDAWGGLGDSAKRKANEELVSLPVAETKAHKRRRRSGGSAK